MVTGTLAPVLGDCVGRPSPEPGQEQASTSLWLAASVPLCLGLTAGPMDVTCTETLTTLLSRCLTHWALTLASTKIQPGVNPGFTAP